MPKIVDRDEMKQVVLDGAMKAFTSKGYHTATIADIAEAAGLGKGTLYLYFESKEAIAEAMADSHIKSMEAHFFTDELPGSLEVFVNRLSKMMDVPDEQARFVRVFFEVFGQSFASETFAAGVSGFFEKFGGHLAKQITHLKDQGAVRETVDPKIAGRMLASLVDGMILHRGLFDIPKKRDSALRREAIAMFMVGLKPASH